MSRFFLPRLLTSQVFHLLASNWNWLNHGVPPLTKKHLILYHYVAFLISLENFSLVWVRLYSHLLNTARSLVKAKSHFLHSTTERSFINAYNIESKTIKKRKENVEWNWNFVCCRWRHSCIVRRRAISFKFHNYFRIGSQLEVGNILASSVHILLMTGFYAIK